MASKSALLFHFRALTLPQKKRASHVGGAPPPPSGPKAKLLEKILSLSNVVQQRAAAEAAASAEGFRLRASDGQSSAAPSPSEEGAGKSGAPGAPRLSDPGTGAGVSSSFEPRLSPVGRKDGAAQLLPLPDVPVGAGAGGAAGGAAAAAAGGGVQGVGSRAGSVAGVEGEGSSPRGSPRGSGGGGSRGPSSPARLGVMSAVVGKLMGSLSRWVKSLLCAMGIITSMLALGKSESVAPARVVGGCVWGLRVWLVCSSG